MSYPTVLMVSQFGQPVRGVSPYADALLASLQTEQTITVHPIDYLAPYPHMLHPGSGAMVRGPGELHWSNPVSWRRVTQIKADIIHIQHWLAPMACYLAPMASMARRHGKKVVITVHNPEAHETLRWTQLFEQWLLSKADALITHDACGAAVLQERISGQDLPNHIIPHGIRVAAQPTTIQDEDYQRCGLNPARRYICIFGNLRGYKGIDVLLTAWEKVTKRLPDIDLVIAGRLWTGQERRSARLAARVLGTDSYAKHLRNTLADPSLVSRVHLHEGFMPDTTIDALLRIVELAVFPYLRFSSQSGAACRAAGTGCPVLVSDVGGLPDLAIDAQWVVPPGDTERLASTLCQLLKDPAQLRAARQIQLKRISLFDWSKIAMAHRTLYRELISD